MNIGKEALHGLVLGVGVYVTNLLVGTTLSNMVGVQYAIVPIVAVGYIVVRAVKADSMVG